MPVLILSSRYTEDSISLGRAAILKGWEVERLVGWRLPERTFEDPKLYLESLFAFSVADQLGITLSEPAEDWLFRLPEKFSGRHVEIVTTEDAREMLKELGPLFVKPPNDKSFPAKVYKELPEYIDPKAKVLVQSIINWNREFRCFVLDKEVRTMSAYWRDGHSSKADWFCTPFERDRVLDFAKIVLAEVEVPKAIVMDIGLMADFNQNPSVIELNPAWGSGIAGCDPDKVLDVIRESCTC
jgi:hypothetical protein